MFIPKSMKSSIATTFYDKTVSIMGKEDIVDEEGGITSGATTVLGTFKGNVSFSNCKKIQEDYGLDYDIDISITTDYELLAIDSLIQYGDIIYTVTDVLPSDSHVLIVATKWQQ